MCPHIVRLYEQMMKPVRTNQKRKAEDFVKHDCMYVSVRIMTSIQRHYHHREAAVGKYDASHILSDCHFC